MEFVVNVNYRGSLKNKVNLCQLNFPNSKLHVKPRMLVIKDKMGTVIMFPSGKFRVMGCVDAVDAALLAMKHTLQIDDNDFPRVCSQSYTSRAKLGYSVNLYELCKQCSERTLYEPELFTAVRLCKYNPISVNVFATGCIVACGLKEPEDMYAIVKEVDALCKSINVL
jgi:TATA-box binding protein (TBP) (component of TFIID and TFIIIB)